MRTTYSRTHRTNCEPSEVYNENYVVVHTGPTANPQRSTTRTTYSRTHKTNCEPSEVYNENDIQSYTQDQLRTLSVLCVAEKCVQVQS